MCQLKLAFLLIKIQPLEEAGVELTRKDYKSLQNKTEIAKIISLCKLETEFFQKTRFLTENLCFAT